ncbi:MAG: bifunctional folylpolyglutamate synthase/dihydrofolate synthase [Chitinophagaceae bacterium]
MTYAETLEYLYARLPMFTRIGAAAIKKDLTNTLLLCEKAGNPHKQFRSIHIAGTNGKGSVSHILASVFQEAGYKTGLYTSPHLQDFRERIRINGAMIPEEKVIRFTEDYKAYFEAIEPSFFEVTVALAFHYFAEQQVDIAVIETGLGGRLDSTNVITPELSIITNIGYDHMQLLGDTLPQIASEKAGIIKKKIPVVIGEYHTETAAVFTEKAGEKNAAIVFADRLFSPQTIHSSPIELNVEYATEDGISFFSTDLPGRYQAKNMATVLAAVSILQKQFTALNNEHLRNGLLHVKQNTGLMGRWEVLQENPLFVLDVGHNEDGMRQILEQLEHQQYEKLHIVIGMVKDKDVEKVLSLLPEYAIYYFTNASIPRALPAEELKEKAEKYGLQGSIFPVVDDAVQAALAAATAEDMVLVCGSVFVVGEVNRERYKRAN